MFFPIGSIVRCLQSWGGGMFDAGRQYTVGDPTGYQGVSDPSTYVYVYCGAGILRGMYPRRFELVQAAPTSRANDPTTSKGKRKVNKYEQAVLDILKGLYKGQGYTGKQIASLTGHPLNCITPRFAPLRRKGLIKDSGTKRDKQIVWVLA